MIIDSSIKAEKTIAIAYADTLNVAIINMLEGGCRVHNLWSPIRVPAPHWHLPGAIVIVYTVRSYKQVNLLSLALHQATARCIYNELKVAL